MKPLVSVIMPAYNHEKFIAQAIEGVLAQKTSFPIQFLIGEDESSDRTRAICLEYANRYPEIISLIFGKREEVIWIRGKPTGRANILRLLAEADGEYIAICEGDDYWTCEDKLETQVAFMQANKDYALCVHDSNLVDESGELIDSKFCRPRLTGDIPLEEFFNENRVATCAKLFRASCITPAPLANHILAYDWLLTIYAGDQGKIRYIDRVCSSYRIHNSGLWQGLNALEMNEESLSALESINSFFGFKFQSDILPTVVARKRNLAKLHKMANRRLRACSYFIGAKVLELQLKSKFFIRRGLLDRSSRR